jgi:hypothetical protein
VLVVPAMAGQPLSPAVGSAVRSQAPALGAALAGCDVAVSLLRRDDLAVRDGILVVRAPVFGPTEGGDLVAAFAAMVAEACAPEIVANVRRSRRAVPAAIVAVAVLAAVVSVVPLPGESGPEAPRAAAAVPAVPRVPVPDVVVAVAPEPPVARVRKPAAKPKSRKAKPKKRRAVAPRTADAPVRVRPSAPRPQAATPPADDIPVAGGDADPLPAR